MRKIFTLMVAVMTFVALNLQPVAASGSTILDLAVATDDLSTLETAVLAADPAVAATLGDHTLSLTVLAPDNDAFAAVPNLNDIVADQELLTQVLLYHVIDLGALDSTAVIGAAGTFVPTALGPGVFVEFDGTDLTINGNKVIAADINGSNGIVHIIDGVLIPPIAPFVAEPANLGEVTIAAGANLPVRTQPGGSIVELNGNPLLLPQDFDNNGFDTYLISDIRTINDITYYGLFIGSSNLVWIEAGEASRTR